MLWLCARSVIDSAAHDRIRSYVHAEIDWDFFINTAHRHRVLPLVYRTFANSHADEVPKRVMQRLRNAFYANARRNLLLTAELFQILTVFEKQNIPAIPYKGPILAAALYGEVSFREFSDLDVIVPKDLAEKATALLLEQGYKIKKEAGEKDLLLVRDDAGTTVELHWGITIAKDPLQVKPEFLWENLHTVSVGGKTVTIHAPEDLLLILCIHGGKHRWEHLGWLCDIAEIIRRYPQLDWTGLMDRASMLAARRILLLGLLLTENVLDVKLPDTVVRQIDADDTVAELATQVQQSLSNDRPVALGEIEQYYMNLRERPADKARVAMNQVKHYLMLTSRDREAIPLRGLFSPLLYFIRPFRLIREYGLSPFWRFFKSIFETSSKKNELRKARLD
jgi:hypothetical protein